MPPLDITPRSPGKDPYCTECQNCKDPCRGVTLKDSKVALTENCLMGFQFHLYYFPPALSLPANIYLFIFFPFCFWWLKVRGWEILEYEGIERAKLQVKSRKGRTTISREHRAKTGGTLRSNRFKVNKFLCYCRKMPNRKEKRGEWWRRREAEMARQHRNLEAVARQAAIEAVRAMGGPPVRPPVLGPLRNHPYARGWGAWNNWGPPGCPPQWSPWSGGDAAGPPPPPPLPPPMAASGWSPDGSGNAWPGVEAWNPVGPMAPAPCSWTPSTGPPMPPPSPPPPPPGEGTGEAEKQE